MGDRKVTRREALAMGLGVEILWPPSRFCPRLWWTVGRLKRVVEDRQRHNRYAARLPGCSWVRAFLCCQGRDDLKKRDWNCR